MIEIGQQELEDQEKDVGHDPFIHWVFFFQIGQDCFIVESETRELWPQGRRGRGPHAAEVEAHAREVCVQLALPVGHGLGRRGEGLQLALPIGLGLGLGGKAARLPDGPRAQHGGGRARCAGPA